MKQTCRANRADGTPCSAAATSSGYCFAHDVGLRSKTAEGRRAGGRNASRPARARKHLPADLVEVSQALATAITDVREGRITPSQAQAMAVCAGAIVKIHEAGLEGRKQTDASEPVAPMISLEEWKAVASERQSQVEATLAMYADE